MMHDDAWSTALTEAAPLPAPCSPCSCTRRCLTRTRRTSGSTQHAREWWLACGAVHHSCVLVVACVGQGRPRRRGCGGGRVLAQVLGQGVVSSVCVDVSAVRLSPGRHRRSNPAEAAGCPRLSHPCTPVWEACRAWSARCKQPMVVAHNIALTYHFVSSTCSTGVCTPASRLTAVSEGGIVRQRPPSALACYLYYTLHHLLTGPGTTA